MALPLGLCHNDAMEKVLQHEFELFCHGCGAAAPLEAPWKCGHCGEPRSIRALAEPDAELLRQAPKSLWHYFDLLPVGRLEHVVSLGEGATPLVPAPCLGAELGFGELMVKNESANPTGSFKDRQVSVGISHAREMGFDTVAVVSSGNVAAATAAYAARAGMKAVTFMHGHASQGKIAQAAMFGAHVIRVDSPSPNEVFRLCMDACRERGWYHLSTAGLYEPFNVEGAKTIAYELWQQYGGALPDWVVAPVGGGGLLGGVWRGFLDLKRLGLIESLPRLVGVQATGCAPLKKAIDEGTPFLETLEDPWPNPETVAGGIADDILFDGHTVLPAIRETGGAAIAVGDEAIVRAVHVLAEREGLLCELTSAVVFAALAQLPDTGGHTRVCALLTGAGIKDLQHHARHAPETPVIPANSTALAPLL